MKRTETNRGRIHADYTWRRELRESIRTVVHLDRHLWLSQREKRQMSDVIERHPMRISHHYLSLIDRNDPDDPIRKMIVPSAEEFNLLGQYDTSGELSNTMMPGLQHKYAQTALILATNRCATYCRYCFRKRLIGLETGEILRRFNDAVKYIERHTEITNVLVSGGDPLILSTDIIERFLQKLSAIDHLNFIRFGTKITVAMPDRILSDKHLLELLRYYTTYKKRIIVVTHINHPREISQKTVVAVKALERASIAVSNQAVLLKGVNDTPEILADLQKQLLKVSIQPYYVFQCRPVKRVKHNFQVSLHKGLQVVERAKRMLDGPSKRFRYVMSHRTGKVEILGISDGYMYFRYHQAKDPADSGKFFKRRLVATAGWLDELE
ncbi:MAG: KamA family radical SAM protein [candidate division WOR-3 bacterium]|nr:MAG: KamA family radical SAM protein [candidate division WOR-3 bacterium]